MRSQPGVRVPVDEADKLSSGQGDKQPLGLGDSLADSEPMRDAAGIFVINPLELKFVPRGRAAVGVGVSNDDPETLICSAEDPVAVPDEVEVIELVA